jgi:TatA/E family protein of Tat protein translocase
MIMMRVPAMVSYQDLLVGLVLLFFFFGAKRLPELAGSLGKSMKEFKKAVAGESEPEVPQLGAAAPRRCGGCQAVLEPDWTHCPRCGAAAAPAVDSKATPVP